MGFSRKKDCGGDGTRRVAKSGLESGGNSITRCSLCGLCGRDGNEHIALSPLCEWSKKGERAYCSVPRNRGKNTTLLAKTFAIGLRREQPAVEAALSLPYNNGQTEGQVNRLKPVKRSMYGWASFQLLRRRFLGAA